MGRRQWFPQGKGQQFEIPGAQLLLGSLITGLVHGLLVCGLVLLVGTLNQQGVQMSMYLAEVLPAAVKQFLLGKTPAGKQGFSTSFS